MYVSMYACIYACMYVCCKHLCHFNIFLTDAGVMHDAGYVYSTWNTYYHPPFGYFI